MPLSIFTFIHFATSFSGHYLIRFNLLRKHRADISMATFAVRIVITRIIKRKRGIYQAVILIVHTYILNPRQGMNYIKRILQRSFIILQHRMIQCAFDKRTDIISTLENYRIKILIVN